VSPKDKGVLDTPLSKLKDQMIRGFLSVVVVVTTACQLTVEQEVVFDLPPSVPVMDIPSDNPTTAEGISLGRMLFYDPILSADSSQACADCHFQDLAFTDALSKSKGALGVEGSRSAMSLANVGLYYDGLFWDGRVKSLEEQSLHPITDPKELAGDWSEILPRFRQNQTYLQRFEAAFGLKEAEAIQPHHIARSLAQFERSLLSFDSKFDRVQRGEAEFTLSELRGWSIFFDANPDLPMAECNHCHIDPLFSNLKYENNGLQHLDENGHYPDNGREVVSGRASDRGKFRVPTLRNITLTAPYMHNGSLATLEEVLDHYNSGGHYGLTVSPNVRPLSLSAEDKADLLAFLNTLTDSTFINNEAFSNPFLDETMEKYPVN
jgi:cytochrome c peroxidase